MNKYDVAKIATDIIGEPMGIVSTVSALYQGQTELAVVRAMVTIGLYTISGDLDRLKESEQADLYDRIQKKQQENNLQ